jgi:SAM-dependent methyltransferase
MPKSDPSPGAPLGTGEPGRHWFEAVARFLGPAYLRYSFTKGTEQEVRTLIELLGLQPGQRVLDVGCGPGRHALALARAGMDVTGIDISVPFVELARAEGTAQGLTGQARFLVADARNLPLEDEPAGRYDAVISLCQGAFGLAGGPGAREVANRELDEPILAGMAGSLAPGGRLAVSAFSAYFQLRYLEEGDTFDAEQGVNHEHTTLRNAEGREEPAELWTSCFTPRELRLLARAAGLEPMAVHGVSPGAYGPTPASIDCAEFLLVARKGHEGAGSLRLG